MNAEISSNSYTNMPTKKPVIPVHLYSDKEVKSLLRNDKLGKQLQQKVDKFLAQTSCKTPPNK